MHTKDHNNVKNLTTSSLLTGDELNRFYNSLSKIALDEFRNAVMEKCDWTYPVWSTRIHSKSKITKLESEAIKVIMSTFRSLIV